MPKPVEIETLPDTPLIDEPVSSEMLPENSSAKFDINDIDPEYIGSEFPDEPPLLICTEPVDFELDAEATTISPLPVSLAPPKISTPPPMPSFEDPPAMRTEPAALVERESPP
jgi:hypothetical protein